MLLNSNFGCNKKTFNPISIYLVISFPILIVGQYFVLSWKCVDKFLQIIIVNIMITLGKFNVSLT